MNYKAILLTGFFWAFASCRILFAQNLQIALLDEFPLESGDVIAPCKIGYRTYGTLNAEKSNVILAEVWFTGNSSQISVGKGQVFDVSKYFIVIVDAFGNGISSSTSNYKSANKKGFPEFNIRDLVRAQHWLLTEKLGIKQLHAVIGTSMGGMQAYEWLVSYPDMVKKVVPVLASPQLSSHDLLSMETMKLGLEASMQCKTCDPSAFFSAYTSLVLRTPRFRNKETAPDQYQLFLKGLMDEGKKDFKAENILSQIKAVLQQDITKPYDGSWSKTAEKAKADVLIIYNTEDGTLRFEPNVKLGTTIGAQTLELSSDCGHLVSVCEQEKIDKAIITFLEKE